jgi:hypothetical protein
MKLLITFYRKTHLGIIPQTHSHAAMTVPLAFWTFNYLKHGAAKSSWPKSYWPTGNPAAVSVEKPLTIDDQQGIQPVWKLADGEFCGQLCLQSAHTRF